MQHATPRTAETLIAVTPNCSLTPRGARWFFAGIALISLLIAGMFVAMGFWPVLPFAGLELFVLGWALGVSMRRGRQLEVIRIGPERIVVERGDDRAVRRVELPRSWARAELRAATVRSYPSKLLLIAHGRALEVGASLTESERLGLHRRLGELLRAVDYAPAGHQETDKPATPDD